MGMQLEFNWYLVRTEGVQELDDGHYDTHGGFIQTGTYYQTHKEGARVYPVGAVVPMIEDDEAVAVVFIREASHRLGVNNTPFTVIAYDVIMELSANDPVRDHYTDMYLAYKKKQETEDHGGRFKTQDFVNALNRRSFEFALNKREEDE